MPHAPVPTPKERSRAVDAPPSQPTVPYIASWTAESRPAARIVNRPSGRGIAYADETLHDRDRHGVLWYRSVIRPGQGRPKFGTVHAARQRRTMRKLLCQVCAGPADRNDDGVLWLLGDDRDDWPGWPEEMGATHPPVCLPCAALSVRMCPFLRRGGHVAVRVRDPRPGGVLGALYEPGPAGPLPVGQVLLPWWDVRMPWVLASQMAMELRGCTFVDLEAEFDSAGIDKRALRPG
ncbi:hypothetical protein [Streptomyces sp. NBC_00448]|uniref:hypothetical protein n=1 Tax=Streptomyces sp. NBC_00448 TaxID=2903652 RepID=UPI002E1C7F3A